MFKLLCPELRFPDLRPAGRLAHAGSRYAARKAGDASTAAWFGGKPSTGRRRGGPVLSSPQPRALQLLFRGLEVLFQSLAAFAECREPVRRGESLFRVR